MTPGAAPNVAMMVCAWRVDATGALTGEGAAQDFWGAVSAMLTGAVGNEGQAAIVMQLKTVRPGWLDHFFLHHVLLPFLCATRSR